MDKKHSGAELHCMYWGDSCASNSLYFSRSLPDLICQICLHYVLQVEGQINYFRLQHVYVYLLHMIIACVYFPNRSSRGSLPQSHDWRGCSVLFRGPPNWDVSPCGFQLFPEGIGYHAGDVCARTYTYAVMRAGGVGLWQHALHAVPAHHGGTCHLRRPRTGRGSAHGRKWPSRLINVLIGVSGLLV